MRASGPRGTKGKRWPIQCLRGHEQEGTQTWKPNSSDVKPEELWLSLIGTLNGVLHAMLAAEQKGNDKPVQDFLGLLRAFITKHAFGDGVE